MFKGSIVAIITPWKNGKFDRDSMADLIDFQIENGTSAIVPCGTTGESATMTHQEHIDVIEFTIEQVRKRVPVIAGTGSNATSEALEMTQKAKDLGADGALLISPYYNKPTQDGIYGYFKRINDAIAIPQIVYNCPGRTGSLIAVDTVVRLSELPHVVALKDAVGSIDYTSAVASKCDLPILSGNDGMNWPIMAVGGVGCISVLANVAPRAVADLAQAAAEGRCADARALHLEYFEMCESLFVESNPIPVKAAAEMMGLCGAEIREPMTPITDKGRQVLKASMKKAGLI